MGKFLEFMSHPHLKPLLLHSARGHTMAFVEHFNNLNERECPFYSKFKVCLYDINQRKYIVQIHPVSLESSQQSDEASQQQVAPSKEIYLVHYNGLVFGANFSKIIIIREREAKKDDNSEDKGDS